MLPEMHFSPVAIKPEGEYESQKSSQLETTLRPFLSILEVNALRAASRLSISLISEYFMPDLLLPDHHFKEKSYEQFYKPIEE